MATRKNAQPVASKSDILDAAALLAREKDISEDVIMSMIEEACKAAFRKSIKKGTAPANLAISITRQFGIQVFARKVVSEEVEDESNQISLEAARRIQPYCEMGDIVEVDVTPADFGRVAAQTAKQVMVQRLREAEHGKIYEEMSDKENEILTGIVLKADAKSVLFELGRTQGYMDAADFMPGEEYHEGDHLKVYVLQVAHPGRNGKDAQIRVSRSHTGLVKRLFEMEVPEIAAGIVQIKSIAREAGSRTKMAVTSVDANIDPVGACVGPRGSRVDKVVQELKNEKIDIIKWSAEPEEFVANALNPAHVLDVFASDEEKICRVIVPDSQLSLAIGKEGQNARLAAKLTTWKIDIKSQSQYAELMRLQQENGGYADQMGSVIADDYEEDIPQFDEPDDIV
ncbi:MAG: transcription termination/antitermination protein NusA [Clostridia bacterium]|nr:transcription termination/antitermination protein NusA [Clostridia bacterium]